MKNCLRRAALFSFLVLAVGALATGCRGTAGSPTTGDSAAEAVGAEAEGSGDGLPDLATEAPGEVVQAGPDPHSYARPDEIAIRHVSLDLDVDFQARKLKGSATLTLDRRGHGRRLFLDTRDLEITSVHLDAADAPARFLLAPEVEFLGRALAIEVEDDTRTVTVHYSTRPEAAALQWLTGAQTAGGEHPFLFTQSQAILARTWIPLQDTPAVRFTYDATIRVPPHLMALMSAENPTAKTADGVYRFRMPQAIPSYLMALAVGDLEFRALTETAGVYAEPATIEAAAWEFADTPAMIEAAEELYGPYSWGRYDLLVLPPSFPFGGMENPRLTFATPTILAGDRSLVALVAHELAHSWSGNLVTNADWDDFWLNEGFTTYFEMRIMEAVFGREYSEMLAALSLRDLRALLGRLGEDHPGTHLHLDLAGRDPDDGMNSIAYDKGYLLLRTLEEAVGRDAWDAFLKDYFERFAFRSMTSERFLAHLRSELPKKALSSVDLEAWIYGPGLPEGASLPVSARFEAVEKAVESWVEGQPAESLATAQWSTHEWLHFLHSLPQDLGTDRMADLDRAFSFTKTGNSEILAVWLRASIRNGYAPADQALEDFLIRVGRRKFLFPLYLTLAQTEEGKARALAIYRKARPGYHPVSAATLDRLLKGPEAGGS